MKIKSSSVGAIGRRHCGFTFVEVMVATAISLITFITFYATMASGFRTIQLARENLRATEIMVGQMEALRLFSPANISSLLPTTFTISSNPGITYTDTVSVSSVPWATSYSANMKRVTVTLQWNSWGVLRQRSMTNFWSQYGVQPYVFTAN